MTNFGEKVSFIWSVADLLRGPYRPNQYKDVMLPMTVLRRLDCVLEPTKAKVLASAAKHEGGKVKNLEPVLNRVAGQSFHNTSQFTFEKLKGDPDNIAANLTQYIKSFSSRARDIIDHFGFEEHIGKLDKADRLYLVVAKFGVEWKPEQTVIEREHQEQGFGGRFGAGLPRINDGSFLFLQHMISKFKDPAEGGTRLAIVFNGSPLFTGSAGSGESEIRRWIIENDWLEAVVAMPDQLFYNTGISTYLWIVTNRKEKHRRGKIQLIDATGFFVKMRKSLGNKRNEISEAHRDDITRLFGDFQEGDHVKIFDNADFGYQRITVERPLKLNFAVTEDRLDRVRETNAFANLATSKKRKDTKAAEAEIAQGRKQQEAILAALEKLGTDASGASPRAETGLSPVFRNRDAFLDALKATFKASKVAVPAALLKAIVGALSERDEEADVCTDAKGNPEPDPELRDNENVPLKEDIDAYMAREVLPHVPDAWVDESKTKVGYEINFNRYFYTYTPPRPLHEIEADLKAIEAEIAGMLQEMTR